MDKSLNYNEKYLLIVKSQKELKRYLYNFKNCIVLKNDAKSVKKTAKFIKENNFKNIIFLDYDNIFLQLINSFQKSYNIKFICTSDLGSLSNKKIYDNFINIYNLYKDKQIDEIGFTDKSMYETYKDKIKCAHIILDILPTKMLYAHDDTIRIINCPDNLYHSFYNELSAITLTKRKVKIKKETKSVSNFLKLFNIEWVKDKDEFEQSLVDLYINFSNNDDLKILESMDKENLCIVGNTSLFDGNSYLKEKLVMKSDDSIDEIKLRIEDVIKSKDKIISEYKKFRKEYSNSSLKSISAFTEENNLKEKDKYDYLISVIVPVYNSEKYLEETIKSILRAKINKMEIIFVNDGSTDKSEEIILKYVKKYSNFMRYFKKKNEGPGSARNLGLKNAKGKYISSVDSDDRIDKNFYKRALKYLKDDIDMVIYDWNTYDKEMRYLTPALDGIFKDKSVYEGILYTTIMPSQCNKIIKKSIYENMKLTYGPGKYEDFDTNGVALLAVKNFKYIRKPYYHYYIRSGSIMRSKPEYDMINAIKLLDERLKTYKNYLTIDLDEYKYYLYSWRIEEYIINVLYKLQEKDRNDMIDYMMKNVKDIMMDIFESSYYNEMLDKLSDKKKEYLLLRNSNIKNDKLKSFLSKRIKEKDFITISPSEMLYEEKKTNH